MEPINPIEKAYRKLKASGKEPIKLFSGNPNEHGFRFPEKILIENYQRYFQDQEYHPHPKGLREAREAIQNYYQTQGLPLDPENIILTSGTSESFFYLFSLLTNPGDNILVPRPAYPLFDHIAKLANVELRHYPLREDRAWELDLDQLEYLFQPRTRALLLVSPNNPTGAVLDPEILQKVVSWANQKDIAVICDEVFAEFWFGKGTFPRPTIHSHPNLCFTLNGISKMFALPALKLSWIGVTGEQRKVLESVDRLETISDTFLSCHLPIQRALPDLFSQGQEFLKAYQEEVRRRRNEAIKLLRSCRNISFVEPCGGFYLMAKVEEDPSISEEEWILQLMEEKRVFVYPGYFFDYEKDIHFVISFLTEPERLKMGIQGIKEFLENSRNKKSRLPPVGGEATFT